MQMGIDLARADDRTACVPIVISGGNAYPLHRCVNCAWYGRGGDDCDSPGGGAASGALRRLSSRPPGP